MGQKQINITLIVILGLLVVCSVVLGLTKEGSINTIENKELFTVQDTARIDLITIKSKDQLIQLKKTEGTWILNEKYKAEQNIVRVLLSILKDAEVVRSVPKSQAGTISKYIKEHGYQIDIESGGKILNSFYASGNENKTISYMMPIEQNTPMIVNIPGYESYVAGIFEIPSNDWRDRVILNTNWRTLQQLNISYLEYPEFDLHIKFEFNFLKVEGVTNLDTARMMAFIDEFNYLQADRYLDDGQIGNYDSLLKTPKTVSIQVADIDSRNSKTVDFYPLLPDDPMMLGYVKEDNQMVLFEANRIQDLFAVKSDFDVNTDTP